MSSFQESAQYLAGEDTPELVLSSLLARSNVPENGAIGVVNLSPYDTWLELACLSWAKKHGGPRMASLSLCKSLNIMEYCQRSLALKLMEDNIFSQINLIDILNKRPTVWPSYSIYFRFKHLCAPSWISTYLNSVWCRTGSGEITWWGPKSQSMRLLAQLQRKWIWKSIPCKLQNLMSFLERVVGRSTRSHCPRVSVRSTTAMFSTALTGKSWSQISTKGFEVQKLFNINWSVNTC